MSQLVIRRFTLAAGEAVAVHVEANAVRCYQLRRTAAGREWSRHIRCNGLPASIRQTIVDALGRAGGDRRDGPPDAITRITAALA